MGVIEWISKVVRIPHPWQKHKIQRPIPLVPNLSTTVNEFQFPSLTISTLSLHREEQWFRYLETWHGNTTHYVRTSRHLPVPFLLFSFFSHLSVRRSRNQIGNSRVHGCRHPSTAGDHKIYTIQDLPSSRSLDERGVIFTLLPRVLWGRTGKSQPCPPPPPTYKVGCQDPSSNHIKSGMNEE